MKTTLFSGSCRTSDRFTKAILDHVVNRILAELGQDPKTSRQFFEEHQCLGVAVNTASVSISIRCYFGALPRVDAEMTGNYVRSSPYTLGEILRVDLDVEVVNNTSIERFSTRLPSREPAVDRPDPVVFDEDVRRYLGDGFAYHSPQEWQKNQVTDVEKAQNLLRTLARTEPYTGKELRDAVVKLRLEKREEFEPEVGVLDLIELMVQKGWIQKATPAYKGVIVTIPE